MMEWIIVVLVVAVVLMAAYIRGLWTKLDNHKESEKQLLRKLEAAEEAHVNLNREADKASNQMYEMLAGVANYFGHSYDRKTHADIWQSKMSSKLHKRNFQDMVAVNVKRIRTEAAAGNREELVSQLKVFYRDLGFTDVDFNGFMLELTTLPKAAANRIELHFIRRRVV